MIRKSFFEEQIKQTADLLDSRLAKKTSDLIYDRIAYNYEESDLTKALDEITEGGYLNYPNLVKLLRKHASMRIETEQLARKKQEEIEAKEFWQKNYAYIKEGMCDRECYRCKVVYCDLVSKEAMQGINDILSGRRPYKDVCKELDDKFKGLGFSPDEPF